MTSDEYEKAEQAMVKARDDFKPAVYERLETLVLERFPLAVGYAAYAEYDDGEQWLFFDKALLPDGTRVEPGDPDLDGGEGADDWLMEVSDVLGWLTVAAPDDYRHGLEIRFA